jgi:hypothetical protein
MRVQEGSRFSGIHLEGGVSNRCVEGIYETPESLFALETTRDQYWHNMAIRIQRAWRYYLRYRAECAARIQKA